MKAAHPLGPFKVAIVSAAHYMEEQDNLVLKKALNSKGAQSYFDNPFGFFFHLIYKLKISQCSTCSGCYSSMFCNNQTLLS